jgi:hypothetical protein
MCARRIGDFGKGKVCKVANLALKRSEEGRTCGAIFSYNMRFAGARSTYITIYASCRMTNRV